MSDATYEDLRLYTLPKTDHPRLVEQRARTAKWALDCAPEVREELLGEGRLEGERSSLRRVLARRRLPLTAEDGARIDACTELATLERWLEQAVDAASTAEALR
jgi:hypothetical protein